MAGEALDMKAKAPMWIAKIQDHQTVHLGKTRVIGIGSRAQECQLPATSVDHGPAVAVVARGIHGERSAHRCDPDQHGPGD